MDDYQIPPPDLRGRAHADRMFRMLGALVTGYEWLANGAHSRRPSTQRVDRDLNLVVDEIRIEGQNVRSYRLVAAGGEKLPSWQPGCHLDVLLPTGRRRQYSLCGDPRDRGSYRIAVRRIDTGAGGSRELHDSVGTGCALTVRGPRNGFPYVRADRYLFIAGGIGITPILPMVKQAAADGAQWQLVYTGRSRASMPFLDELSALDPARVRLRPYDEFGFPASGSELLQYAPNQATVYCCGPAPIIANVRRDLPDSAAQALHFERFTTPPIVDGRPFEIALTRSNRVLTVPADRSALDVIRQQIPDIAYSCQRGFCGTCRSRVISGEVDHRDRVLTDGERTDTMTICVSRSRGDRIVLDL
ncbi:MAG: 2Fe-2S iron-sulfur cluster binding domain-containing protein [Pseudonocardiaceae bacterium]|nr:2Fe-2S iron-sulfur cluster binding domain-containing protein [Pseudonocardiaceae bacterium]